MCKPNNKIITKDFETLFLNGKIRKHWGYVLVSRYFWIRRRRTIILDMEHLYYRAVRAVLR